jgi:protein-histidine pros-kinase
VEVDITDTGPGIPDALRLKVFEPFFSTKKSHGGARGVGLSLAQEIVSRHCGVLEFDGRHKGGCHVRVSFPRVRPGGTVVEEAR